jgi:predicted amidophosphoribosyltransferase
MFCTNCGNKTNTEDNFCGNCGKAIKRTSVSEVERPSPKVEPRPTPPVYKELEYVPPPIQPSRRNIQSEAKAEKKKEEKVRRKSKRLSY